MKQGKQKAKEEKGKVEKGKVEKGKEQREEAGEGGTEDARNEKRKVLLPCRAC